MNLKKLMDSAFKFNIGDTVGMTSILRRYEESLEINGPLEFLVPRYMDSGIGLPAGDMIMERWLQECHGGVQKHYRVRRLDNEGREAMVSFAEFELVPIGEIVDVIRRSVVKKTKDR